MFVQSHIQKFHRQSYVNQHQAGNSLKNHQHNHRHQLVAGATNRSSSAVGLDRSIREKSIGGASNRQQGFSSRQESEGPVRCRSPSDQVGAESESDANSGVRTKLDHTHRSRRALIKLSGPCGAHATARLKARTSDARFKLRWRQVALKVTCLKRLSRDPNSLRTTPKRNADESNEKLPLCSRFTRLPFIKWLTFSDLSSGVFKPIARALKQTLNLLVLYLGSFIRFQWESLRQLFMGDSRFIGGPGCSRAELRHQHVTITKLGHNQSLRPACVEPLPYDSSDGANTNFDRSQALLNTRLNSLNQSQKGHLTTGQNFHGPQVDHRQNAVPISIQQSIVQPSLDHSIDAIVRHRQLYPDHHHGHLHQAHWFATPSERAKMRLLPGSQPSVRSSLDCHHYTGHRTAPSMHIANEMSRNPQRGLARGDLLNFGVPVGAPTDHMFWRCNTIDGCAPLLRAGHHDEFHEPETDPIAYNNPLQPASTQQMYPDPNNQQEASVSNPRLNTRDHMEAARNQFQPSKRPIEPPEPLQHHHHHHNHRQPIRAPHQEAAFYSQGSNFSPAHFRCHSRQHPDKPFQVLGRDKFERQLSSIIGSDSENCQIPTRTLFFNSSPSLSSTSSVSSGLNQMAFKPKTHIVQSPPPPSSSSYFGFRKPRSAIYPQDEHRLRHQASSTTSDASFSPRGQKESGNQLASAINRMSLDGRKHSRRPFRSTESRGYAVHSIDYRRTQSANGQVGIGSSENRGHSPPESLVDSDKNQRAKLEQALAQNAPTVHSQSKVKGRNNGKKVCLDAGGKSKSLTPSSIGATAATLGKVSLAGAKRRLGFKQNRGLNSLSVHRSEEIFPSDLGANLLAHQHTSTTTATTTTGLYSLNDSFDQESQQSCGTPRQRRAKWLSRFSSESPDPKVCFVEGLGDGQIVSRQALVSPYLGDIQVSISDRRGMLEVEVIRIRQLQPKPHAKRMPAISVKVYLMKDKKCLAKVKTTQISHTLSPMFQQSFVFRSEYIDCVLQIIVWGDYGKSDRKSLMGIVQIHLNELDISDMVIGWYKLFNAQSMVADHSIASSSKSLRQTLSTTKLLDLDPAQSSPLIFK